MSSNYFCSASDKRSWADMISNQTAIADFRIRDHVNAMRSNKSFPLAGLPAFVHECTHHWCFESAVGLSLALIWVETWRDFIVWNQDDVGSANTLKLGKSRLFRYELISLLLRPILEGLALFAEFDAFPGDAKFTSTPMLWAWLLYSETKKDFQAELEQILTASRLTSSVADRKVNVLAKALSVSDTDGYLAGYLSVKTTSFVILESSSKFVDSDFFLSYVREYFFEDPELVSTILTEPEDEWKWAEGVIHYFKNKIKSLAEGVNEGVLEEFEQTLSNPKCDPVMTRLDDGFSVEGEVLGSPLFKNSPAVQPARKQLHRALADVIKNVGKPGFEWLEDSSVAMLIRRHLMCLGSYPTRVRINEFRHVVIYDEQGPILAGESKAGFDPQEGDGVLDFYVSPTRMFRAYAVSLGASLVLLHPVSRPNQRIEGQLSDSLLSSEVIRKVLDSATKFLETNRFDDPQHQTLRAAFGRAAHELYETWSTVIVERSSLAAAKDALRTDGLWTVMGGSLQSLRALASIGLCQSVGWDEKNTSTLLKQRGIDHSETLRALSAAAAEWGFRLFREGLVMI
jgi:hypothetical protein